MNRTVDSGDSAALLADCVAAAAAARGLTDAARDALAGKVGSGSAIDRGALEAHQFAVHGLAWLATYAQALTQMAEWGRALDAEGRLGPLERLILAAGCGEYLAQITGGIAMSQGEIVRPEHLGLAHDAVEALRTDASVKRLIAGARAPELARQIAELIADSASTGAFGDSGLDEMLEMIRDQFRRFAESEVVPHAHDWHLNDQLIPLDVIARMSEMGVFGLTIPERYGGSEMGKIAMCVVSEELSRGYIGVGSLGTRSEIAAELILNGGTEAQREHWLPKIASGEVLPTAVFTEPNTGSDLGSLTTRATRTRNVDGQEVYRITGAKTWITHAARADLMTLLVRTDPAEKGYKGLSMLLAEKPRATDDDDFPVAGLEGSEIEVLGYRGMKEYELAFDGFEVAAENLLGGEEGRGFKQLMTTFEAARIQTAARAIGVAQAALELGLTYARERVQFGKPIFEFPRVHGKIAAIAVELMIARQLTYFAARRKDEGKRCDLEAGMAKLLAARVAWSAADNALQIHGGNGYATEYAISRVLCDARILNIFEGAAEIQAQVIARRLLETA